MSDTRCHRTASDSLHEGVRNQLEIADIFRQFRDRLGELHHSQWKVVNAIVNCRTSVLGAHAMTCGACGHQEISYNSCRNRHCPKCRSLAKYRWVEGQLNNLLPVPYFHAVFTMPGILRPLALYNKAVVYSLLFRAVSETIRDIALNERFLGARTGLISVLHTWDQQLNLHPHVHCLMPGGGLSPDSTAWIGSGPSFFLPVRALAKVFRGKFLASLEKAYGRGELSLEGYGARCGEDGWKRVLKKSCRTPWVVYCKAPFSGPEKVVEYLGRYTHRVALTDNRIVSMSGEKVSFSWRDRQNGDVRRVMSLDAVTFLKRFLLHVLPDRFVKIRYYGIFANPVKKRVLNVVKMALGLVRKTASPENSTSGDWRDLLKKVTGIDLRVCPACGAMEMRWEANVSGSRPAPRSG